jgi:hypothetical protein
MIQIISVWLARHGGAGQGPGRAKIAWRHPSSTPRRCRARQNMAGRVGRLRRNPKNRTLATAQDDPRRAGTRAVMTEPGDAAKTLGATRFIRWFVMLPPLEGRSYLAKWRQAAEDYSRGGWAAVEAAHPGMGFSEEEAREVFAYIEASRNAQPISRRTWR